MSAIERLPRDTATLLHNSLVHIVRLRRGKEVTNRQVQRKGSRLRFYWRSCAETGSRSPPLVPWDQCGSISAISRSGMTTWLAQLFDHGRRRGSADFSLRREQLLKRMK